MRVVVLGAGPAGLAASLLLSRRGHDVTLVERDTLAPCADPLDALDWERRGIAHFMQPHGFLPGGAKTLREHLPDVHDALLEAGGGVFDVTRKIPGERRPGDDDLVSLVARRPIMEWALRRAVLAEARIRVIDGARVTGIVASGERPPRVTGVRTSDGTIDADFVVDALGRTSPMPSWLAEQAGAQAPVEESNECGLVYYSRYYRVRDGHELPDGPWLLTPRGDLGYAGFSSFLGDNRTFAAMIGVAHHDRELRVLRESWAFQETAASIPVGAWTDPGVSEPITPVLAMGTLRNTLRRFVVDGAPVARGVAPVADAYCHTNPMFALGLTLSLVHAVALTDALDCDDPEVAYFESTDPMVRERFDAAVATDDARNRIWAGERMNPLSRAGCLPLFLFVAPMIAALFDGDIARLALRRWGALDPLHVLERDEATLDRIEKLVAEAVATKPPPPPIAREALLERLEAARPSP